MELLNIIKENIFLIILIILILGGIIVVGKFIRNVDKTVRRGMRQIDTVKRTIDDVQNIARVVSTVAEAAEDMDPTPKSVGGATNMHLKNILSDGVLNTSLSYIPLSNENPFKIATS